MMSSSLMHRFDASTMTLTDPPQRPQTSMSMPNPRFRRCAQVMPKALAALAGQALAAWHSGGGPAPELSIAFRPLPRLAEVTSTSRGSIAQPMMMALAESETILTASSSLSPNPHRVRENARVARSIACCAESCWSRILIMLK